MEKDKYKVLYWMRKTIANRNAVRYIKENHLEKYYDGPKHPESFKVIIELSEYEFLRYTYNLNDGLKIVYEHVSEDIYGPTVIEEVDADLAKYIRIGFDKWEDQDNEKTES